MGRRNPKIALDKSLILSILTLVDNYVWSAGIMTDAMIERLRFAQKQYSQEFQKCHVQVQGDVALMQELEELADQKRVSITTYRKASHRVFSISNDVWFLPQPG
jgi:hypothetical protein